MEDWRRWELNEWADYDVPAGRVERLIVCPAGVRIEASDDGGKTWKVKQ